MVLPLNSRVLKAQMKALFAAMALCLISSQSAIATEIPKDTANSVMWEYVAKEYLLTENNNSQKIIMDDRVIVRIPKFAEDQFNIPVHVDARAIKNVKKIVVIADLNPLPKVLTYLPEQSQARLSFRIKVEQATPVRAAVLDKDGVWHIGVSYIDAAGGGCSQPALAHGKPDWVQTLAEVRAKIWRKAASNSSKMRVTIKHPMDTGLADGIPAFYVEELQLKSPKGVALGKLFLHEPVSENPTLTLYPNLKAATNTVILQGRDNEGNLIKVNIPAPVEASMLQPQTRISH